MASIPLHRWLVVVRRDHPALYASLQRRFDDVPQVDVIFDRREGERRRATSTVLGERQKRDRRSAPSPSEREHWHTFGYRLVALPSPHRAEEGG